MRLVVCLVIVLFALPVDAASYSTDNSDLWWADPPGSENGWGIQFVQRSSTIFATMFVYNSGGQPTWYVSTMTPVTPGSLAWSGALYSTTGPWFGSVPYQSSQFAATEVGTMTFTPASQWTGSLSYSVSGTLVTKSITRQTLVSEDYSGHFGGALHAEFSGCTNASFNGTVEGTGTLTITEVGNAVTMQTAVGGTACVYAGTLVQHGQGGDVRGNFSCTDGSSGSYEAYELQVTERSVVGHFRAANSIPAGCQQTGWFGGVHVTTF